MPEKAKRVMRKGIQTSLIVTEAASDLPLDVEGIDLDLTEEEIIEFIHDGRKHT